MSKTVDQLIEDIVQELSDPVINKQRSRFLKDQLEVLTAVKNKDRVLSKFEEYCLFNPECPECLVYDV